MKSDNSETGYQSKLGKQFGTLLGFGGVTFNRTMIKATY